MAGKFSLKMPDFHVAFSGSFTCRKYTTWDPQLYFPSEGRRAEDFFALKKNPTASAGFEHANLGSKGQYATSRPPKPLSAGLLVLFCKNYNSQNLFASIIMPAIKCCSQRKYCA
jgi:hypothetical protein